MSFRSALQRWWLVGIMVSVWVVLGGCGSAPSSLLKPGTSLTRVVVSRSQALPPPYGRSSTTYTDPGVLQTISHDITSRGLSPATTTTSGAGCAGGIAWSVALTQSDRSTMTIHLYACGGATGGNVTGDLAGFVSDLQGLP